jgi:hypothetical protein
MCTDGALTDSSDTSFQFLGNIPEKPEKARAQLTKAERRQIIKIMFTSIPIKKTNSPHHLSTASSMEVLLRRLESKHPTLALASTL